MMDRLNKTTTEYGMKINTKKVKVSRVEGEEKNMKITVEGKEIEQVTEFCYLGSLIFKRCKIPQRNHEKDSNGKRSVY